MRRTKSAWMMGTLLAAAVSVAMVMSATPVRAGIEEPELAIDGSTGVPGGTVSVTLSLADDIAEAGVSAGIDLVFGDALEFFPPVADSCAVAERLEETHGVAGRLLQSGVLNLEVFVSGTPNPPPALGNGPLVTCDFRIKVGVPAGTVALEIASPFLGDDQGQQIPVRVRNGSVEVVTDVATPTPTSTATPQPTNTPTVTATRTNTGGVTSTPTATATNTGGTPPSSTPTATNTRGTPTAIATSTSTHTPPTQATATATATRTGATPTATRRKGGGDSGCSVAPMADQSPAAALLLLPALLLWVRRRI